MIGDIQPKRLCACVLVRERERERERERQTDRRTDVRTDRQRQRNGVCLSVRLSECTCMRATARACVNMFTANGLRDTPNCCNFGLVFFSFSPSSLSLSLSLWQAGKADSHLCLSVAVRTIV